MGDLKNINNNILANRWKQRYAKQPIDIQRKLDQLNNSDIEEYQLCVIKRKRIYPKIGDVFKLKVSDDITLYGVVVNNHINNINGDDLLVVFIFTNKIDIKKFICEGVKKENLFIPPQIVGKEYWTRGYFYNEDFVHIVNSINEYGFYSIGKGKFVDEYGNELANEPKLLGTYGVATISGVARKINQELIISKII